MALERNVGELLRLLGEDPCRDGLEETPRRFREAWREWTRGYRMDARRILKTFEEVDADNGSLVLMRDIPVYSHCEHHMTPFFGVAHIGYMPNGRVVGLSKIPRLVEVYARRLQVQERLTHQISSTIDEVLMPHAVGVVVQCRHLCVESRGARCRGTMTISTSFRGPLKGEIEERMMPLSRGV